MLHGLVIFLLVLQILTETSANVTWTTNWPATSEVEYGLSAGYELSPVRDAALVTQHNVVLADLAPGNTYHWRVRSQDVVGNVAYSPDGTFTTPEAPAGDLRLGGLLAYPVRIIGSNLLTNSGFEQVAETGKPANWKDNGFVLDTSVSHSEAASFRLTDAHLIPYTQSAYQDVPVKKGVYRISAWVKTSNLAATQGSGVRVCLQAPTSWPPTLGSGCTGVIKGTNDWTRLEKSHIVIIQDTTARFSVSGYADPDGTAWFDDVELRRDSLPLEVFLLHPNYRGILFDDQSQRVRCDITVDPPEGTALTDYQVQGTVTDETTGAVVLQTTLAAAASLQVEFDFTLLPRYRTYLVKFQLVGVTGGAGVHEYPAYRVSKVAGSIRQQMTVSFDEHNRFLLRGQPAFPLGVYDSGLGYTSVESNWENVLTEQRRLFELPINFYLNYWYGEVPNSGILPMLNVLQRHGIYGFTNANGFSATPPEQMAPYWFFQASDAEIQERTQHPGFAGFYACDECIGEMAPKVFLHTQRMGSLDPDGMTIAVMLMTPELPLWRDTVDVFAINPYPLYGVEPAGGYPLAQVGDWVQKTREYLHDSRPVLGIIQFFKFTANSRWPTQSELRNMSYMAITEGADGLFYWSLGAGALAYVCSGWCEEKVEYFNRLKAVVTELKGLEPALRSLDRPDLLVTVNDPANIRVRVKFADGKAYLIAYNYTSQDQSATFTWHQAIAGDVVVHNESRSIASSGATWTDSFTAYAAHVYVIAE